MKKLFRKLVKAPFSFIKRVIYKTIIGPIKYRKKDDYDAERYWKDRFSKYGLSLKGSGNEGLSEKENKKRYLDLAEILTKIFTEESINFKSANILDIGCGTGFFTEMFYDLKAKKYIGIDITSVLFPRLREKYSEYVFLKMDITSDNIEGKYDLILMIDVIEHIVNESKLISAMENVKRSLSKEGVFIVAPLWKKNKKRFFYLKSWSSSDLKQLFSDYIIKENIDLKEFQILIKRKQ